MKAKLATLTVSILALQTAAWAAGAVPVFAPASTAQAFRFNQRLAATTIVIGLTGPAIGYEDRVPQGKVLESQYAILHALMGFQGRYGEAETVDRAALKAMDLEVTPLSGAARAIMDARLGEIRHLRNDGVPSGRTRRTITLQQLAERHRALIRAHAASLKALPKGTLSAKTDPAPAPGGFAVPGAETGAPAVTPRQQYDRVLDLVSPLSAIRTAATPDELTIAVARFNAAAAAFGKGYRVTATQPGEALSQALSVYRTERAAAFEMGAIQPDGAMVALPDDGAMASKADLDARFDGSGRRTTLGGDGLDGVRFSPSARTGDGSELTQNAPQARADREPPSPGAGGDAAGGGPGLFGLLGALFKAVVRTVVRVVTAAVKGAAGVAKALLS